MKPAALTFWRNKILPVTLPSFLFTSTLLSKQKSPLLSSMFLATSLVGWLSSNEPLQWLSSNERHYLQREVWAQSPAPTDVCLPANLSIHSTILTSDLPNNRKNRSSLSPAFSTVPPPIPMPRPSVPQSFLWGQPWLLDNKHTHLVTVSCSRHSPQQSRKVCGTCPLPLLFTHGVRVGWPQTSDLRCGHMTQVWLQVSLKGTPLSWALILQFLPGHWRMRKPFS